MLERNGLKNQQHWI